MKRGGFKNSRFIDFYLKWCYIIHLTMLKVTLNNNLEL